MSDGTYGRINRLRYPPFKERSLADRPSDESDQWHIWQKILNWILQIYAKDVMSPVVAQRETFQI